MNHPDALRKDGFGLSVSILGRSARAYFQKVLSPFGIGPGQQAYLLALRPGEAILQDELSRRLRVDKANVTRAVHALSARGYVSRRRDAADGRAHRIALTDRGEQVRSVVEGAAAAWLDRLRTGVSPAEWAIAERVLEQATRNARDILGGPRRKSEPRANPTESKGGNNLLR